MGPNTRIYGRFTGYTVKDCACEYCLYYGGKRRGCMVESCCCLKERLLLPERTLAGIGAGIPSKGGNLYWKSKSTVKSATIPNPCFSV